MAQNNNRKYEMEISFLTTIICLLLVTMVTGMIQNSTFVIRLNVPQENENSTLQKIKNSMNINKYFINIFDEDTVHVVYHHPDKNQNAIVEKNILELRNDVQKTIAPFFQVKEVLSGFFCEKHVINENLTLPLTKLSHEVKVNLSTVKCVGSPYRGAQWSQSDIEVILYPLNTYSDINQFTKNLTLKTNIDVDEIRSITSRLNEVSHQSNEVLNKLQEHNHTNVLLARVDSILLQVRNVTGFEEKVLDNVAVRVENTNDTGGTGIAVIRYPGATTTSKELSVRSLNRNDTIETIFHLNFTVAIQLPASALQGKNRVVFTSFSNASIFKVNSLKSAVIGVVVEGESGKKFDEPVRLYFRRSQSVSPNPGKCVYWDFNANANYGNWSDDGCKLHKVHRSEQDNSDYEESCDSENKHESFVIDEFLCDHLTHFGELMLDHSIIKSKCITVTDPILDLISLWGSIVSITFTLTYIGIVVLNKADLLKRPGEKSKLQLTINFAILLILFITGSQLKIQTHTWRVVLGLFTHYFMLCNFTWMFNAAILQYRRLVIVFNDKSKKLMAWILPIFPPLIAYSIGGKDVYSEPPLYLPRGLVFYLTIVFPLAVVMFFNVIVFVRIAVFLYSKPEMRVHKRNKKNESNGCVKQLGFIFFLLGIGWMFALGQIVVKEAFVYIFSYVFVFFISLQGFVYFLLFVVMDKEVMLVLFAVKCK